MDSVGCTSTTTASGPLRPRVGSVPMLCVVEVSGFDGKAAPINMFPFGVWGRHEDSGEVPGRGLHHWGSGAVRSVPRLGSV